MAAGQYPFLFSDAPATSAWRPANYRPAVDHICHGQRAALLVNSVVRKAVAS